MNQEHDALTPPAEKFQPQPAPTRPAMLRWWQSATAWVAAHPTLCFAAALFAVVLAVYHPAWNGGQIWDDDAHITRPGLRSWYGLALIWSDPHATQQYYPLLHSAFWVEEMLWGEAPLGYHLVSILLHALAAVLVARVLRRLAVPGAYLAAAIFALHPVCVESVAWISEQKNTLSAVFYLAAALAYLKFDETRKASSYGMACLWFVLGLASKTVTATLPAALLVIFWWKRGRLSWRRDVLPLVPLLILGAGAGLVTAWVERNVIGAKGADYDLSLAQRCLIAGRAPWFYAWKLFWPVDLLFVYPHWTIDSAQWRQWVFPVASAATLATVWATALYRQWRGLLAGVLFFVGTLMPVLGFCNVYPFRFSFVADHFQYLASLGMIALAAGGAASLLRLWRPWGKAAGWVAALALLTTLAVLTWRQSTMYSEHETFYRRTLAQNPNCYMTCNNLGTLLRERGENVEASKLFSRAAELKPDAPEVLTNCAQSLFERGEQAKGIEYLRAAIAANPSYIPAYLELGTIFIGKGQLDEAAEQFRKVLEIRSDWSAAYYGLGRVYDLRGQRDEAIAEFREALRYRPNNLDAIFGLADCLAKQGHADEAMACLELAVATHPESANAFINLAAELGRRGKIDDAITNFRVALSLQPNSATAHHELGEALLARRRPQEAIDHLRQALAIQPNAIASQDLLAVALTASGHLDEAIALWKQALATQPKVAAMQHHLGVALAQSGHIDEAIVHFRKALDIFPDFAEAHDWLGNTLQSQGKHVEAVKHYRAAHKLQPNNLQAMNNLAWILATSPDAALRKGAEAEAVTLAEQVVKADKGRNLAYFTTLAAAYAENKQFSKAIETVKQAIDLAAAKKDAPLLDELRANLKLYEAGVPYREQPNPPRR